MDQMKRFVEAVESSLAIQNWHSALFTALPLPDVCGKADSPNSSSRQRYVDFFSRFMADIYTNRVGPDREKIVLLNGEDFYALRCAFLHEGSGDISQQRAQQVLSEYQFVAPEEGFVIHRNRFDDTLQLQVDIFCKEICDGVEQWNATTGQKSDVEARLDDLLTIYSLNADT